MSVRLKIVDSLVIALGCRHIAGLLASHSGIVAGVSILGIAFNYFFKEHQGLFELFVVIEFDCLLQFSIGSKAWRASDEREQQEANQNQTHKDPVNC
ncbi:MAG: hypothetical protein BWY75_02354 [bacterium ADurb.Bin425]|nr:MAG: hypothetical protein BWY75_02354 [bacterium ADurb.Bin425]